MPQAFKHLCTIEGDSDGQLGCDKGQAHRNTITSLCIVPFRDSLSKLHYNDGVNDYTENDTAPYEAKLSMSSTKKIFSSSLDSTIKCWHFKPLNPESRYQSISPNGQAIKQNDYVKQPTFNQHDSKGNGSNQSASNSKYYTYKFNEIQQNGRASKRVKNNSLVYYPHFDILVSGGTDRFINVYENC